MPSSVWPYWSRMGPPSTSRPHSTTSGLSGLARARERTQPEAAGPRLRVGAERAVDGRSGREVRHRVAFENAPRELGIEGCVQEEHRVADQERCGKAVIQAVGPAGISRVPVDVLGAGVEPGVG